MPRSVFFVSLVFLSIHLAIAAWLPLFDDEAYYALWARDLAAGYYDHPPMIAYMIHFGTSLMGETAFGIRLVSVICFSAAGYLVGDIARISGDRPVMPVLATTLYNLNLLVLALGSFATPDAPSTLFWVAALWAACRAVTPSARTGSQMLWWLGAGLMIGLGCLSKFTNAFLAVGLLAYLFSSAKGRSYLLTHLPFVATAAAVLPLIPYFLWNLQNDWLGLQRQGARLIATGFSTRYLWEYVALLFLAPTPLVSWFALKAASAPPRHGALLAWSSIPLVLYFFFHATHAQVQANWIVPLQGPVVILAAAGLTQSRSSRFWIRPTVASALLISFGSVAVALNPFTPIGTADNPPNQMRGWPATEDAINEQLRVTGAQWIATTDYARTGMLAFRFPHLPVWSVTDQQRYGFRGPFPTKLCNARGLLVERARQSAPASQIAETLFETVGGSRLVVRGLDGVSLMTYRLTPVSQVRVPGVCVS